jgi:hypothetical protein
MRQVPTLSEFLTFPRLINLRMTPKTFHPSLFTRKFPKPRRVFLSSFAFHPALCPCLVCIPTFYARLSLNLELIIHSFPHPPPDRLPVAFRLPVVPRFPLSASHIFPVLFSLPGRRVSYPSIPPFLISFTSSHPRPLSISRTLIRL